MIKKRVVNLVKKHKTNNPFEIAAAENINVHPWDLHEDIQGFYKYIRRNKYIFYNSNMQERFMKFVVSHELGHATLHPREDTTFMRANTLFSVDLLEVQANTFAVELLIPDEELNRFIDTNITIKDVASMYGVPKEVSHLKKVTNKLGDS